MTRPSRTGEELARIETAIPGPRSVELAGRLASVESRNITPIGADTPIFWAEAAGSNIIDVDGNVYVDLTAGFGVAHAGHANPRVARAISRQADRLPHALGDVHPADIKTRLLERLAALAPGDLSVTILGSTGAEAVEAALKTGLLASGRPGILAFERGYHGLTAGALAVTSRPHFREPFRSRLYGGVAFAPFPAAVDPGATVDRALERAAGLVEAAAGGPAPIGTVIVEPIQGRGGLRVPVPGFLPGLRQLCDELSLVLVFDEVYTGFGRTGRWFACEHWNVVPDLLVIGKAATGSVPLSATIGRPAVMSAWPVSDGEAIHTSTFLGHPIGCAAALAQIEEIEIRGLHARAAELGARIRERTLDWRERFECVRDARGLGLLQGLGLAGHTAIGVAAHALQHGVLVLPEGENAEVLAITPPAVITEAQLDFALDVIESAIALHGDNASTP